MTMIKRAVWAGSVIAILATSSVVFAQQAKPQRQVPPAPSEMVPPPKAAEKAAAPAAADADETRGGWRSACQKDVKQFCRGASGGHDKRECLEAAGAKVAPACRASLDDRADLRKDTRRICRTDLGALCPEAAGGKAELACLRQKTAQLTPSCGEAVKALGAR